jgi:uncharacterized membrane protein (UPF0127 family)
MNFVRVFALSLLSATMLFGCRPPEKVVPETNSAPEEANATAAQPKLTAVKLYMGPAELTAEVAISQREMNAGLMFRTNMAEGEGMLFVFPYPHQASFWMKNTILPLSIAYIDPAGVIQEIHELEPHNTNAVSATSSNIQFALEVNRGWFARNKINVGTLIQTERGELKQSFSGLL